MDNRARVREFLASRRARITPDQAGLPAYLSRVRAVAAVQSASNLARAPGSRCATAARIAAGSRSGSGTTGCSPDIGRWLMKPMLAYPSDSQQASSRLRPMATRSTR